MHNAERARKLPKNYLVVLDVIAAQPVGCHAAANEVYAAARRRQPTIGYSTVYRALERLCDEGLVHEVRVAGTASALYEAARHNHAHFLCTGCGAVRDIAYAVPADDLARLDRDHAIAIADATLTFHGLCESCRHEISR
jgi:Fur family transcriptional regulator, stress-responsive regulator